MPIKKRAVKKSVMYFASRKIGTKWIPISTGYRTISRVKKYMKEYGVQNCRIMKETVIVEVIQNAK